MSFSNAIACNDGSFSKRNIASAGLIGVEESSSQSRCLRILIPQETIRVDVGFYSDEDRRSLLRYPTSETLEKLTTEPIQISAAEFLTYYLFDWKRLGTPGYRDYSTVGRELGIAMNALADCIEFTEQSIRTAEGVVKQLNENLRTCRRGRRVVRDE